MTNRDTIAEPEGQIPIVRRADLVVVGGGPAGIAAAVAGARSGLSVVLLERYAYLGGLASGGMVLVLDDMCNGAEISVRGLCSEMVERMERMDLCVVPPEFERRSDGALWRKWSRWGVFDFHSHVKPQPICYAAAFDPDGFKRASNAMVREAKVDVRLHSWFSRAIVEDGRIVGVVCESKNGRQAIMGKIVVDATGDLDVAASAGAPFTHGSYMVTTVFRLGGVNVDAAERFEYEEPGAFRAIDREAKRIIGGSWDKWWLKTPLPGIVWCNCPHMTGLDGIDIEDLTRADFEGRERIAALVPYVREKLPGFEQAFVVDVAPQIGVRQTRLLDGVYVVTKDDVMGRRHFPEQHRPGGCAITTPPIARCGRAMSGLLVSAGIIRHLVGATVAVRATSPCTRWARRRASPRRRAGGECRGRQDRRRQSASALTRARRRSGRPARGQRATYHRR